MTGSIEDAADSSVTVVPAAGGATAFRFSESVDDDLEREEYDAEEYDLERDLEEYEEDREYDRSLFLRFVRFTGIPSCGLVARPSSE